MSEHSPRATPPPGRATPSGVPPVGVPPRGVPSGSVPSGSVPSGGVPPVPLPEAHLVSRARRHFSPSAIVWLTLVWVLLWGEVTVANVAAGILVAVVVTMALPLPAVPFAGRPSLLGVLRLLGRLMVDIVVASIHVSAVALRFGKAPHGGVIRVELRSTSDLYLTLTADLCSVVPGSLIVEAHRRTGTLYVHNLDLGGPDGVEQARRHVLEQEARVLYALASPAEIALAGLPPRRFGRAARTGVVTP